MIKSVSLFFDDNTRVDITGSAENIQKILKNVSWPIIAGVAIHENVYRTKLPKKEIFGEWNLEVLKKLLKNEDQ